MKQCSEQPASYSALVLCASCWLWSPTLLNLPAYTCPPTCSFLSSLLLCSQFLACFTQGICEALMVNGMPGHGPYWLFRLWMSFIPMSIRCQSFFIDSWSGMPWGSWVNMHWHACVSLRTKVWFIQTYPLLTQTALPTVLFWWYLFFFFGHTVQVVRSQFPNQRLNLGHGSESPEP